MERSGEVGTDTLQFIPRLWATRKIGYLLTQVRLNGPQQELIDQIVRLSIRYGIVTPYTSYLVTEPMPFGADEQERIAEEEFLALEAAPNAPTYGRDAVEKAAGQGEMEGSDVAVTPLHESADIVRVVGSRTFVFSVDAWVDTAYDPETMQTLKVAFLSDDYFALASSRSHLAAAFSLGARVIAISDGIVYEVVDQDTPTEPIDIPIYETPDETPTIQINDGSATIVPEIDPTLSQNEGTGMEIQPDNQLLAPERQPCLGGLLPLVLLPLAVMTFYREKES
jgi:Ca-activated chloride channel family protein